MARPFAGVDPVPPLSATDFHVLLVLSGGELYGYGIMKAVEQDSGGTVAPEVGSLYRILARLIREGFVEETAAPPEVSKGHRGSPRKYYGITSRGGDALRAESLRLSRVVEVARTRKMLPESGG